MLLDCGSQSSWILFVQLMACKCFISSWRQKSMNRVKETWSENRPSSFRTLPGIDGLGMVQRTVRKVSVESFSHFLTYTHFSPLYSIVASLSQSQHDESLRFITLSHRDNSDTALINVLAVAFPDTDWIRDVKDHTVHLGQIHSLYKAHVVSSRHLSFENKHNFIVILSYIKSSM